MSSNTIGNIEETDEIKEIRANLRETFLKTILALKGRPCDLDLFENTQLKGIFNIVDAQVQDILIDDFVTPSCVDPHSILRASDTIAINFKYNINE